MELSDSILIEFPFSYREFTGAVEHTELTDIDRAVGSKMQSILCALRVYDESRQENAEFARFCKKRAEYKLFGGEFQSPSEFLQKLTSKCGDQLKRNELLPTAYISREPEISFPTGDAYIDVPEYGELKNNDDKVYAVINKSFVTLSYSITMLAWNQATLSRMALGVMMWNRHQKKGRKHVFQASTRLANAPMTVNVELTSMKDAMSEPAEVDHDNSRLYASTIRFEVIAEVFEAEELMEKNGKVEIGGGIAIE